METCQSQLSDLLEKTMVSGVSYATDLLFNIDGARLKSSNGLSTQHALINMLKARINLEIYYASELTRIAEQSNLETMEDGTFKEALAQTKGQYINSSVQHKTLAECLQEEVLTPILQLYKYNSKKAQRLSRLTTTLIKEAKSVEDQYLKFHARFERNFREASAILATAIDADIPSETIEKQYKESITSKSINNTMDSEDEATSREIVKKSKKKDKKGLRNQNGVTLVGWLLPSEQQKRDNLGVQAMKTIEHAENSRIVCSKLWKQLEDARIQQYWSFQSLLVEYQLMEEKRVGTISSCIKKHVVYESSCLANKQYDWQVLSTVLESIDPEYDFRQFIQANQRSVDSTMTFSDLCKVECRTDAITNDDTTRLPIPPSTFSLEVLDFKQRKIPLMIAPSRSIHGWLATPRIYDADEDPEDFTDKIVPATTSHLAVRAAYDFRAVQEKVASIRNQDYLNLQMLNLDREDDSEDTLEDLPTSTSSLISNDISRKNNAPIQEIRDSSIEHERENRSVQSTPEILTSSVEVNS